MSLNKGKCSGPRFYDYLNGLREEFELLLAKSTRPRRFSNYLEGLKLEFELMAEDIESLRNEVDESEAKVKAQAKAIRSIRRGFVCGRCSKGSTSTSGVLALPLSKTTIKSGPSSAKYVFQRKNSGSWRDPLQTAISHSSRRMSLIRKLKSTITTTQCSRSSDTIVAHSQNLPSPQPSPSTVDPDSGRDPLITFEDNVGKELDIEIAHVLSHEETIWSVKFSQDGKYLAAGCGDGKAYIHEVCTGILTHVLKDLFKKADIIKAVCFSRDGEYLATGSWDGGIYIWEINTKYIRNVFKGHTRQINSIDFSPNGQLLVSASDDNTVRLWKMRGDSVKVMTKDKPTLLGYLSAVFSPDGGYVAASHFDRMVRIWDVCTGQLIRILKAHEDCVYDIACMPDGKGLVSASWDSTLRYWDIGSLDTSRFCTGSQTMDDSHEGVEDRTQSERKFCGHTRSVYSVSISPDGRWVASGSSDRSVRVWDVRNAETQCVLIHDDRIWAVNFSPVGCYLASGGSNGTVRIWRYSSTQVLESQDEKGD